jgi:hypothetical protein
VRALPREEGGIIIFDMKIQDTKVTKVKCTGERNGCTRCRAKGFGCQYSVVRNWPRRASKSKEKERDKTPYKRKTSSVTPSAALPSIIPATAVPPPPPAPHVVVTPHADPGDGMRGLLMDDENNNNNNSKRNEYDMDVHMGRMVSELGLEFWEDFTFVPPPALTTTVTTTSTATSTNISTPSEGSAEGQRGDWDLFISYFFFFLLF